MSFTETVKSELARLLRETKEERAAELLALLRMSGSAVTGGSGAWGVEFSTANNAVARRVLQVMKKDFGLTPSVMVRQGRKLRKKNVYQVMVPPGAAGTKFLQGIEFCPMGFSEDETFCHTQEMRRAYLAGAFLGGGTINRPQGDYHLELVTQSQRFAEDIMGMMKTFRLQPKQTDRKSGYIVYVKEGDSVARFLQIIGAVQCYMEFETVRVTKDVRNKVNRQTNCDMANEKKSLAARERQMAQIRAVRAAYDPQKIPESILETMLLREENPYETLAELSEISGISKSGLAHRFQKLAKMAEEAENGIK